VAESEVVLAGALTCLEAVARAAAAEAGGCDVAVRCAGVRGELALDDAYVAGRLVERIRALVPDLGWTDSARAASLIAAAYPDPLTALRDSESARDLAGTGHEEDVARCAQVSTLDVVPIVTGSAGGAVSLRSRPRPPAPAGGA
jgi:phosphosulfolactate phosphohydrolase-like enzyme